MSIFEEIKSLYFERINDQPGDDRTSRNVEMRAALSNAMAKYCHYRDIANLWGKDRSTVYNLVRKHDAYMMTSESYRVWYDVAKNIVEEKFDQITPKHLPSKKKRGMTPSEQIMAITGTIKILQNHLKSIEDESRQRESEALPEVRKEGLGDDDRDMGSGEVHRVLRDEQLQVPDESRGEEP